MADNGAAAELPSPHKLRARYAAHASWANTTDPSARTAPARRAFLERFERQVDPNQELPEAERQRRAESARKAYYARLQWLSAQSRAKAAAARRQATELEARAEAADAELDAEGGDAA